MIEKPAPLNPKLKKIKHRNRLMYIGGLGCLALIVLLLVMVALFFNLIVKLISS